MGRFAQVLIDVTPAAPASVAGRERRHRTLRDLHQVFADAVPLTDCIFGVLRAPLLGFRSGTPIVTFTRQAARYLAVFNDYEVVADAWRPAGAAWVGANPFAWGLAR